MMWGMGSGEWGMAFEDGTMATDQAETGAGTTQGTTGKSRSWIVRVGLWGVAIVLAGSAMVYQRATGPTYPLKGEINIGGRPYSYELPRSSELVARSPGVNEPIGAVIKFVFDGDVPPVDGAVAWRRWPTEDSYQEVPFKVELTRDTKIGEPTKRSTELAAEIPPQPPAGKVEYFVTVTAQDKTIRLPTGDESIVLRYKDFVPRPILYPHIIAMIFVIVIGMRAALSALFDPRTTRRYAWVAFILMTVGGMMLGPLVQKYAFGEYWTGFPWGGDWTDNKMLVMWLAWLVACVVLGASTKPVTKVGRAVTVAAAIVMTGVYLIPHSMGGSQLDYEAVEQGVDPQEAIRTGRG